MIPKYMDDELLLDIAITCAVIGIAMIFLITRFGNYNTELEQGLRVKVTGNIAGVKYSGNTTIISVIHECTIEAKIIGRLQIPNFNNISKNVSVEGIVNAYNGKTTINADKIIIE